MWQIGPFIFQTRKERRADLRNVRLLALNHFQAQLQEAEQLPEIRGNAVAHAIIARLLAMAEAQRRKLNG